MCGYGATLDVEPASSSAGDASQTVASNTVEYGSVSALNRSNSTLQFSRDVKRVLYKLRSGEPAPCISGHLMMCSNVLLYSKTWTLANWEQHNSHKR